MESIYHIVTIRVNETSWAHVWRLRSRYLGTGYDTSPRSDITTPPRHVTLPSHGAKTSSLPLLYLSVILRPVASPFEPKPKH
jgi:hypothetical protein